MVLRSVSAPFRRYFTVRFEAVLAELQSTRGEVEELRRQLAEARGELATLTRELTNLTQATAAMHEEELALLAVFHRTVVTRAQAAQDPQGEQAQQSPQAVPVAAADGQKKK